MISLLMVAMFGPGLVCSKVDVTTLLFDKDDFDFVVFPLKGFNDPLRKPTHFDGSIPKNSAKCPTGTISPDIAQCMLFGRLLEFPEASFGQEYMDEGVCAVGLEENRFRWLTPFYLESIPKAEFDSTSLVCIRTLEATKVRALKQIAKGQRRLSSSSLRTVMNVFGENESESENENENVNENEEENVNEKETSTKPVGTATDGAQNLGGAKSALGFHVAALLLMWLW